MVYTYICTMYSFLYGEFENEKKKGQKKFDLPEQGFEPQIFSNFPAHDLNFHVKWGARDQIKKASKGDRNLPLTIFSVCLEEAGFESQISLLSPPENFNGKLKVPGRESKEVVITEVWGGANQGFGSCFSSRKKKVQFEFKVLAMVFCYQNCSDLLWEKKVLLIVKNF